MNRKKELRKITQSEKAVLQARGEAIIFMGAITMAVSLIIAIFEIAMGNSMLAFGFIAIVFVYLAGAALFSYKYQKTKGYLILGITGIILGVGSIVFFLMQ